MLLVSTDFGWIAFWNRIWLWERERDHCAIIAKLTNNDASSESRIGNEKRRIIIKEDKWFAANSRSSQQRRIRLCAIPGTNHAESQWPEWPKWPTGASNRTNVIVFVLSDSIPPKGCPTGERAAQIWRTVRHNEDVTYGELDEFKCMSIEVHRWKWARW